MTSDRLEPGFCEKHGPYDRKVHDTGLAHHPIREGCPKCREDREARSKPDFCYRYGQR